jgi:sugar lactone lactonase YvrE
LFNAPNGIAVSGSYVYIADTNNSLIRRMSTTGAVTTFAGGQGDTNSGYQNGAGTVALFSYPAGLALDTAGNLYVADEWNDVIRKVTTAAAVSTYAGNWARSYLDGPNLSSSFNMPKAVVVDSAGNLYVADTGNNVIRKIE